MGREKRPRCEFRSPAAVVRVTGGVGNSIRGIFFRAQFPALLLIVALLNFLPSAADSTPSRQCSRTWRATSSVSSRRSSSAWACSPAGSFITVRPYYSAPDAESFMSYNPTYGAIAGAMVLMLWFHVPSLAVLVGGE